MRKIASLKDIEEFVSDGSDALILNEKHKAFAALSDEEQRKSLDARLQKLREKAAERDANRQPDPYNTIQRDCFLRPEAAKELFGRKNN